MFLCRFSQTLLLLALSMYSHAHAQAAEPPVIQKVAGVGDTIGHDVVIDTRPLASCRKSTLQNARCLPVEDVLAPQRRLANWSGIMWLLGSAGLTGEEHVLITGQNSNRRDFIAGLLVLAGQHRVSVVDTPTTDLMDAEGKQFSGAVRATTRSSVYTATMRSHLIVLRSELRQLIDDAEIVLDGRSEGEYFGVAIRTVRGGHIAGAVHSPYSEWRANPEKASAPYQSLNPIAYAHDTFDSLVYFAALQTAGINSKVYLAGWVDWASDGALPVDSASYPSFSRNAVSGSDAGTSTTSPKTTSPKTTSPKTTRPKVIASAPVMPFTTLDTSKIWLFVIALAMLCLLVASFYTGRNFPRSRV